jgi:hypothetical protein
VKKLNGSSEAGKKGNRLNCEKVNGFVAHWLLAGF